MLGNLIDAVVILICDSIGPAQNPFVRFVDVPTDALCKIVAEAIHAVFFDPHFQHLEHQFLGFGRPMIHVAEKEQRIFVMPQHVIRFEVGIRSGVRQHLPEWPGVVHMIENHIHDNGHSSGMGRIHQRLEFSRCAV